MDELEYVNGSEVPSDFIEILLTLDAEVSIQRGGRYLSERAFFSLVEGVEGGIHGGSIFGPSVVYQAATPVGLAYLRRHEADVGEARHRSAEVFVYVKPEMRNHGIGTSILVMLRSVAKSFDVVELTSVVSPGARSTKSLLERGAFKGGAIEMVSYLSPT